MLRKILNWIRPAKPDVHLAILDAACHLEGNSESYSFLKPLVPDNSYQHTAACPLAWIGYYLGLRAGYTASDVSREYLGVSSSVFFLRMNNLMETTRLSFVDSEIRLPVAYALREYADIYHPREGEV